MLKRRKFSLIEMLVVISIIFILVSILLPSLGRSKKMARRAICVSNLKQWSVALISYASDNNGYLINYNGDGATSAWSYGEKNNPQDYNIEAFGYNMVTVRNHLGPYGLGWKIAWCPDGFYQQGLTDDTEDVYKSRNGNPSKSWNPEQWWNYGAPDKNHNENECPGIGSSAGCMQCWPTNKKWNQKVMLGYSYFPWRSTRDGLSMSYEDFIAKKGITTYKRIGELIVPGTNDQWVLIADINTGHNKTDYVRSRTWAWTHMNHPSSLQEGKSMYNGKQMYISEGVNNAYLDGHVAWVPFNSLDLSKAYQHSHWKYNFHWQ